MVTTASKLYFAAAFVAYVGAWAYGLGTDAELIGVATLGLRGAVGEHIGYAVLMSAAAVFFGLGTATSILRDADPEVQARVARLETLPPAVAPSGPSYWPILGALGAVVAAIGLVASPVLFVIGLIGVGIIVLEWTISAWSERATGDPVLNRRIRNRLMYPIEIPVVGALGVIVMIVSMSRVFLAVSATGAWIIGIVAAAVILTLGFVIAYRPQLGRSAIAAVLVLFGALVIAGGIIGAANGTREFHHEDSGHADDGAELPAGTDEGEG